MRGVYMNIKLNESKAFGIVPTSVVTDTRTKVTTTSYFTGHNPSVSVKLSWKSAEKTKGAIEYPLKTGVLLIFSEEKKFPIKYPQ